MSPVNREKVTKPWSPSNPAETTLDVLTLGLRDVKESSVSVLTMHT